MRIAGVNRPDAAGQVDANSVRNTPSGSCVRAIENMKRYVTAAATKQSSLARGVPARLSARLPKTTYTTSSASLAVNHPFAKTAPGSIVTSISAAVSSTVSMV